MLRHHSFVACLPIMRVANLCFPGALYSRKINLDGEQVSLQVQDTPCVSLQVGLLKHTMMCPKMAPDSLYSALLFTISLCALVRRSALHCDLRCHLEHPGVSRLKVTTAPRYSLGVYLTRRGVKYFK